MDSFHSYTTQNSAQNDFSFSHFTFALRSGSAKRGTLAKQRINYQTRLHGNSACLLPHRKVCQSILVFQAAGRCPNSHASLRCTMCKKNRQLCHQSKTLPQKPAAALEGTTSSAMPRGPSLTPLSTSSPRSSNTSWHPPGRRRKELSTLMLAKLQSFAKRSQIWGTPRKLPP